MFSCRELIQVFRTHQTRHQSWPLVWQLYRHLWLKNTKQGMVLLWYGKVPPHMVSQSYETMCKYNNWVAWSLQIPSIHPSLQILYILPLLRDHFTFKTNLRGLLESCPIYLPGARSPCISWMVNLVGLWSPPGSDFIRLTWSNKKNIKLYVLIGLNKLVAILKTIMNIFQYIALSKISKS